MLFVFAAEKFAGLPQLKVRNGEGARAGLESTKAAIEAAVRSGASRCG
jgi:hypothetical protein